MNSREFPTYLPVDEVRITRKHRLKKSSDMASEPDRALQTEE
jgi:hypothetical protein